ncbi:MAG TPA: Slp family lipoprotein [Verrucomicrobiae bacterium]|jgi:outer membrane lipoprotein|nr:Slp family lipoprotein [Verrucomicrobiae bacterium]
MNASKYLGIGIASLLASALALVSGCASYPISKEYRQHAREITIAQVRANPDGTRGSIVIWGGRIINVVNDSHGSSMYILCLPSGSDERPIPAYDNSPGRFIATSPGFLDPEMYPQGSLITVAGQLNGVRTELLDNIQYAYPVLQIQEAHLWRDLPEGYDYDYYSYPGYYYGPGPGWYGWGGWGPSWWWGWGWGGYYPYGYYRGGYHGGLHGGFHNGGGTVSGGFHGSSSGGSSGGGGGGGGGGFHGGFHGGSGGGSGHGR